MGCLKNYIQIDATSSYYKIYWPEYPVVFKIRKRLYSKLKCYAMFQRLRKRNVSKKIR